MIRTSVNLAASHCTVDHLKKEKINKNSEAPKTLKRKGEKRVAADGKWHSKVISGSMRCHFVLTAWNCKRGLVVFAIQSLPNCDTGLGPLRTTAFLHTFSLVLVQSLLHEPTMALPPGIYICIFVCVCL